jgi:SpoVK/Ycf46/Vps4 family AAA+-type ATPase
MEPADEEDWAEVDLFGDPAALPALPPLGLTPGGVKPWTSKPLASRAGYHSWRVCSARDARRLGLACEQRTQARRRDLLLQLAEYWSRLVPLASYRHVEMLRRLEVAYPNFGEVINAMAEHVTLLIGIGEPIGLPAMLLDGPPGTGKTAFTAALARALGASYASRSLAEASAAWILTGNSGTWHDADAGVFAQLAAKAPQDKLPLLLIDELDKARAHAGIDAALLGVLEPATAASFRDEFLGLEIDASPIAIVCTSNSTAAMRPELLSRLRVFSVPLPNAAQMPAIARSVDMQLRTERHGLAVRFFPLGDDVIEALATSSPRDLRRILAGAYTRALLQDQAQPRIRVRPHHLRTPGEPSPGVIVLEQHQGFQ